LWESASGPALSCFSDSYGVSPFETRATGRRLVRFTIDGIQAVRSDPFEITVNAGSDVVAKYFNNAALPEYYYLNLQTALQEASTNGGLITLLKEEISVDSTLSIAPNSSLEIAPGTQSVIKRHNFSGPLFTIATGTVTLSGALTLDGTGTAAGPLVKITGGAFGINAGVILKNNNRTSGSGGAVEITGGTFTMRGGSISSNSAPLGGGVYIGGNARFDFSGGFLSGNTANTGNGIYNNGTFTMAGAAYAAAGNDVYLANGKTIAVNSALLNGPAPVIQITPYSYSIGISVLSGNAYSSEYTKFTLAANNDRYGINAQGLLAKKIGDFSAINSTPSPMIFVPEGNITVSGAVVIPAGKDVTIATPAGDSVTISRGSTYTGEIFNVTGGSLTLGGGGGQVVIEGNSGATGALVNVSEQGTLTIQDGTVLQNNERSSSEIGGGLYVTGGSTLIMTGGKIHKNKAGNSGGIELRDGSRFDMRGGEICYNEGGTGGGVQLRADTNSIMTMTGGSIHHNRANYGGGVHIGTGSTLFINAPAVTGSIFENTAINTPPNVRKNGYFYVNETDATGY
jgi:hypothetical protein